MATSDDLPRLTLIGRGYCHLCEAMEAALHRQGERFRLEVVDLDDHPQLEPVWGREIPVLLAGEREICRHRLDQAALDAFLAGFR